MHWVYACIQKGYTYLSRILCPSVCWEDGKSLVGQMCPIKNAHDEGASVSNQASSVYSGI